MKRVYITTLQRLKDSGAGKKGKGNLYIVDWDTKEIISKHNKEIKSDSTGKSVGLRGLDFYNDDLYIADNSGRIYTYDTENYLFRKNYLDFIKSENCYLKIHQIRTGPDNGLWISYTGSDKLIRIENGEITDKFELNILSENVDKYIEMSAQKTGRPMESWGKGRLHFNSIGWNVFSQIHIYNSADMIFDWTKKKIIYQGDPLIGPHDIIFIDQDSFLVSNTFNRSVAKFTYNKKNKSFDILEFGKELTSSKDQKDFGYTRGLRISKQHNLLFSCSFPGYIRAYNLETLKLVEYLNITEDINENIFDICLDPKDWR